MHTGHHGERLLGARRRDTPDEIAVRSVTLPRSQLCLRKGSRAPRTVVNDLNVGTGEPKLLAELLKLTDGSRAFLVGLAFDVCNQLGEVR